MTDIHIESHDSIDDDEMYAYGSNTICGVGCPAIRAGIDPGSNPSAKKVMVRYDLYARLLLSDRFDKRDLPVSVPLHKDELRHVDTPSRGFADPETAREAWNMAVESADDAIARDTGRRVARELGWANE